MSYDAPGMTGSERVVAAAVQYEGVTFSLPRPARHGQVLHCLLSILPEHAIPAVCQGFITSDGRFVNRVQAKHLAHMAGQTPNGTTCELELYSEDLW
jgi:hypothetical protein